MGEVKTKFLENTSEFRYMYFGIILTIIAFLGYKIVKEIVAGIKEKNKIKNILKDTFKSSYFIGILASLFPMLLEIVLYKNYKIDFSKEVYIRLGYMYALFIIIWLYKYMKKHKEGVKKILDFCTKNRYIIFMIVFVVLVLGKIHFSSIGAWSTYIKEGIDITLIGQSRAIRSDEWLVTTPFCMSQAYNSFKLTNENLNLGNNDMNIFHAPVLDVTIIVRILYWGYILLGSEYGFSWFWVLKLIVIFAIYFELGQMLTKKDKLLSLMCAVLLTFSPAGMWWSIREEFPFAMAIVVLFHAYLANSDIGLKKKILIAAGMVVALCNFAYLLYPAWQIPLMYIVIVFVIVDYIKYRKNLKKNDYIIMLVTILVTAFFIGYFVLTSWESISDMMSTIYPGSRAETGGDFDFSSLTNYYTNFFTPYTSEYDNPSNLASFIYPSIAMLVIITVYIINTIRDEKIKENIKKIENWYIYGLLIVLGIFLLFMGLKWPEILAKISMLSNSTTQRVGLIFEFGCSILLIMLAYKVFTRKEKLINKKVAFVLSLGITILACVLAKTGEYAQTFTVFKLTVLLPAIFAMNYTLLSSNKKAFAYTMVVISLYVGAFVNPISSGISIITDTEIATQIRQISSSDEDAIWAGATQINAQYLAANGIKVINGINEYPNYDWIDVLDPEHQYEEVWNRYAHITFELDEKTYFELEYQDAYTLHITYEDLKKIGIKYYYSFERIDENIQEDFNMDTIYENDESSQYIYVIN